MFQGKRPLRTASPSCGRVEEVELSVRVQLAPSITRAGRLIQVVPHAIQDDITNYIFSIKSSYLSPTARSVLLMSKSTVNTSTFRGYGVFKAFPFFQAGWSNCASFFSLFNSMKRTKKEKNAHSQTIQLEKNGGV
jgi:hypothetical protein